MGTPIHLTIDQGTTFIKTLEWQNPDKSRKDLTGYTARMQIRSSYTANAATETLSTQTGEIVVTGPAGVITITLPATRTAAIPVDLTKGGNPPKQKYVYDLEVTDTANNVTRLMWGNAIVVAEVTR